jgi:hypothetical protein
VVNIFTVDDIQPAVFTHFIRCEVQFDYGLRQKRSRKLEQRPDSFISSFGKEIPVDRTVAARNDQHIQRGKVCVLKRTWFPVFT